MQVLDIFRSNGCLPAIKPDRYTDSYTVLVRNQTIHGVTCVIDGEGDVYVVTVQRLTPSEIPEFKDYIRRHVSRTSLFAELTEIFDTCPPDLLAVKRTASERGDTSPAMEDWYSHITSLIRRVFFDAPANQQK